eukprot:sb/3471939/
MPTTCPGGTLATLSNSAQQTWFVTTQSNILEVTQVVIRSDLRIFSVLGGPHRGRDLVTQQLLSLYHYGGTMSLYVTCKRECNITRYTASLSRHALSYFHFHLSLVTLHLLLDTLLSLSLDTQCIFSLSLFSLVVVPEVIVRRLARDTMREYHLHRGTLFACEFVNLAHSLRSCTK